MSEHEAFVACSCFRDGRARPSPIPRAQLVLDELGNVMVEGDESGEDSPEEIWDWRETACLHRGMRIVQRILDTCDPRDAPIRAEVRLRFPNLAQVLDSADQFSMPEILADSEQSARALPELEQLMAVRVGRTRVVLDGRERHMTRGLDVGGLPEVADTVTIGSRWPAREVSFWGQPPVGALRVDVEGMQFVVRRQVDGKVLLTTSTLGQRLVESKAVKWGQWHLPRLAFTDSHGTTVEGVAERIGAAGDATLRIDVTALTYADFAWYLHPLQDLLHASIETGNPIVGFYNGCSLGY